MTWAFEGRMSMTIKKALNRTARELISTGERTEYEWDHRNRLVRVVYKDEFDDVVKVVEHSYDYQNRWVRSQVDADGDEDFDSERFFAYDGNQIVLAFDGDSDTDLTNRYLWGPVVDQILADEQVTSLGSAGDVIWPLTDHLGTARDLAEYTDGPDTTAITNHRVYDSFGNLVSETNAAVDHLFGFTARPWDEETDLQYNLNRWYDPVIGQWMSEDPIGFEGLDPNVRRYVHNSGTLFVDSTGLQEEVTPNSLSWDNFKQLRLRPDGAKESAMIGISYEVEESDDFATPVAGESKVTMEPDCFKVTIVYKGSFTVSAKFDAEASWVMIAHRTEALLKHEKIHLSISTHIASEWNAAPKKYRISGEGKGATLREANDAANEDASRQITELVNALTKALASQGTAANDAYDTETNHGTDPTKQAEWEANWKAKIGQFINPFPEQ
jgi:RHS repeat-associated protein